MDEPTYDRLIGEIRDRIERVRRIHARIMLGVHSGIALGGISLFIFALRLFSTSSVTSGFIGYLSLLFSDSTTVLSNWSEFILSILESAPLGEMALLFTGLLITFISARTIASVLHRANIIQIYRV